MSSTTYITNLVGGSSQKGAKLMTQSLFGKIYTYLKPQRIAASFSLKVLNRARSIAVLEVLIASLFSEHGQQENTRNM